MQGCVECCVDNICMYLCTGERFFGESERADVRAVWRNAAINAEALTGNQGNELCNAV